MFTLYSVCSVNWGIFGTSGDVQYMGGYHEYIGACSVHQGISLRMWGDTMCISGDVQYIGEIPLVRWGDVQYIGGYHDACGGYHEYIEGCSAHQRDIMMHLGEQCTHDIS